MGSMLRRSADIAAAVALAALTLLAACPAEAQVLPPSEPIALAGGRVTVSGDVSASLAPEDTGFFNYTDYEHSALRLFRADLAGAFTINRHVSLLAELRDENIETFGAYAFYIRIRPWADHQFDIQAGRVPPVFGAFARRSYASDNPLIGYPLAYQYLTALRPDSLPWNADDLLRMRGRGWATAFSIGDTTPNEGVPLVTAFRWDTGVQLHAASGIFDGTVAVTTGTLSNPRLTDDNSAPQVAARLGVHPSAGLNIGVSGARGPFVSSTAARGAVGDGHDQAFTQSALGADVEYSSGYYLIRGETIWSEWKLPQIAAPFISSPLRALSSYVEGRYKLRPGLYVAGRIDHLGFSDVTGSTGMQSWDAPVSRVEAGAGYSLQRNLLLKFSVQRNVRGGGRVTSATYPSVQVVYWF
ncbi:MAG TPA: hypothetical protein VN628_18070 [Vicinamibacterales bacterium]|nr:hypothetical protein [Vicinamibacterales bacterium]